MTEDIEDRGEDLRIRIILAVIEALSEIDPMITISIGPQSISVSWHFISEKYHPEPLG